MTRHADGAAAPAAPRTEARDGVGDGATARPEDELLARLLPSSPTDRLWGWVGPLLVTALAAVLRLVGLNHPARLMFDETYYVKQAYSLLQLGYEGTWAEESDEDFARGDVSGLSDEASYVVHPQVGKWLIAIGLRLFGADNGAGWRVSAALAGIVTVLLVARIARRLFGSTWLGMAAGLLLAVDGLHLTGSRIGLLDVFLGLFVVAGLGAVLLDREQNRRRLAAACARELAADDRLTDPWGPRTGVRWWLVGAGVLLGIACGVKWSGIYGVAVLGLLVLAWDIAARRAVGVRLWVGGGAFRGGLPAFLALVPTAALTYAAGWWSWFRRPGAFLRQWAADEWAVNGAVARAWLPDGLNSWWEYHLRMWDFHTGLDSEHTYAAQPAGWLLQLRPTAFYWESEAAGCGAERCVAAIASVGNPVVWWLGALALVVVVWAALVRRDWRAWVVLAGYGATYLPWFAYAQRTIFTFYGIAIAPYVALAVVFAIAWLTGLLPPLPRAAPGAAGQEPAPSLWITLRATRRVRPRRRTPEEPAGTVPAPEPAPEITDRREDGDDLAPTTPAGRADDLTASPYDAPPGASASPAWPATALPSGQPPAPTDDPAPAAHAADAGDDTAGLDDSPATARAPRARLGWWLLGAVCVLAVVAAIYFWPVWTGQTVTYDDWNARMWLGSWV